MLFLLMTLRWIIDFLRLTIGNDVLNIFNIMLIKCLSTPTLMTFFNFRKFKECQCFRLLALYVKVLVFGWTEPIIKIAISLFNFCRFLFNLIFNFDFRYRWNKIHRGFLFCQFLDLNYLLIEWVNYHLCIYWVRFLILSQLFFDLCTDISNHFKDWVLKRVVLNESIFVVNLSDALKFVDFNIDSFYFPLQILESFREWHLVRITHFINL